MRDGIAALPPKHRGVIVLFYLHGRSINETAEILGIRPGTVKSRLHFGLRSLRVRLEDDRRFGGRLRAGRRRGRPSAAASPWSPSRDRLPAPRAAAARTAPRWSSSPRHRAGRPGRSAGPSTTSIAAAACEAELATTTLVLHALRRLHEETLRAEPAADGWARLRERLAATRREPSRLLSGLPGHRRRRRPVRGPRRARARSWAAGRPGSTTRRRGAWPPSYLVFEQSRERARRRASSRRRRRPCRTRACGSRRRRSRRTCPSRCVGRRYGSRRSSQPAPLAAATRAGRRHRAAPGRQEVSRTRS